MPGPSIHPSIHPPPRPPPTRHAKKHPACLQGALGFWGVEGLAGERGVPAPKNKRRPGISGLGLSWK
eukprot:4251578-Pyramimonas_sp.AAC.1